MQALVSSNYLYRIDGIHCSACDSIEFRNDTVFMNPPGQKNDHFLTSCMGLVFIYPS